MRGGGENAEEEGRGEGGRERRTEAWGIGSKQKDRDNVNIIM